MDNKLYVLNNEYSIKKINRPDEFEELESVWNELAEKQGPFEPFLSFDWFKIWLGHFLEDNSLLILLLCKGDEVVAIAPLLTKQDKFKRIKVRKIELIGNIYSPIRYFLFNSSNDEERETILFYIFEFFAKFYKNWDIIDLYPIPEENRCFDLLKIVANRTGFKPSDYSCFGDWYTDGINSCFDEYLSQFTSKFRHSIRYRKRNLEKEGKLEFKVISKEEDDIDYYMDFYYRVYSKSWQREERIGPTFHRSLAKMAAEQGWLRLSFLFLNNLPISSQFWIICNKTGFILKTVYDQEYKKFSPGKILTEEMIKYAIDMDRVETLDYVHGDEPYKEDWTPKRRERKGITIYNGTLKGQYLYILENKVLPFVNKNQHLKKIKRIIANRLQ